MDSPTPFTNGVNGSFFVRKHAFINEGIYHIYCRGVDRRDIFMDDVDRARLLNSLLTFNDSLRIINVRITKWPKRPSKVPYANIIFFCFMNNHLHLCVQQRIDDGVSKWLQRTLNSYTKYFNARHGRTGRLFESTFKSRSVETIEDLIHLSRYIHMNPISLVESGWKERGIKKAAICHTFLRFYPWSSFGHYIGRTHQWFIDDSLIRSFFDTGAYAHFVDDYIGTQVNPLSSRY